MANALTTKARVKDRLQITATNFDDLIDRLILAVTARMERMCNRAFIQATYTHELYDGSDMYGTERCILMLKNAPALSIASVQYKTGLNSNPTWGDYDVDDYDVDMASGILYFASSLPRGKQNIRVTYSAGYAGSFLGIVTGWVFNVTPTGTVNGVNLTFTLPGNADEVIVYADGMRISSDNYTFTAGTDSIVFDSGNAPFSTISADYKPTTTSEDADDPTLPLELVEVCEEAVIRLFKRRDSEGRSSETFNESTITWSKDAFNAENIATVKNYRRGTFL